MKSENLVHFFWLLVVSSLWLSYCNLVLAESDPNDQIDWLIGQQDTNTGLVESHEGNNNNFAYIFDQALAIIAFAEAGKIAEVKMVLDTMEELQLDDPNGAWNEWYITSEPNNIDWGSEKYVTGPIAWMVIAINYYEDETDDANYAPMAYRALGWLDTMRNTSNDERYGSLRYCVGPRCGQYNPNEPNIISTEHNLDAYSAYYWRGMLDANDSYLENASLILDYLREEMWAPSPNSNCVHDVEIFWEGYNDFAFATDCQSWGVLSLGPVGPDGEQFKNSLNWLLYNPYGTTRTTQYYNDIVQDVNGFKSWVGDRNMCDPNLWLPYTGDPISVWVDGTEHVAAAFYSVGDDANGTDIHNEMGEIIDSNGGLVHSFCEINPDNIRWPENYRHNYVASAAWYYFNKVRLNPFNLRPWTGGGSENNPYLINDAADMQAIGADPNYWDAHFKLTADINLSAYTGTSFNIIGNDVNEFTGVFNGNDHTISNFNYTCTDVNYIGLFGYVRWDGEIKNVGLIDPNVDAGTGDYVGALVGWNSGTASNCYATGTVTGGDYVGGLVGSKDGWHAVSNCYATGTVTGNRYVGGLVGYNSFGSALSNCYATGSVTGNLRVGGLVGENYWGTVSNCYATRSVTGGDYVGGLVGGNSGGTVSNCYAIGTGTVTGDDYVGGFAGHDSGTISVSFWDTQTSGEPNGVGGGSAVGVTGKTTAEMKMMSTFFGWGCEPAVWTIDKGNDYPHLAWENKVGEPISPVLSDRLTGVGTENEPYLIYTADELNLIGLFSSEWGKHFKLMQDIDLDGLSPTEFNIIAVFAGVFDGNGHTISNFSYTSTGANHIGLFRYVDNGGEIKNLGLIDPNVDAGTGRSVGSLVGCNDGMVSNCYAGGSVTRGGWVGGLVGDSSGTVSNCYATGDVMGTNYYVTGTNYFVGGLIGRNRGAVSNCYAGGSVTGDWYVGGLVGDSSGGTISNCCATGTVTGYDAVGGLMGDNYYGTVSNCYAIGSVTGNWQVGGFAGHNNGTISASFWDTETSGQVNGVGLGSASGVTGKPTEEMQMESTFTSAGWDFSTPIWKMNCEGMSYPKLSWWQPVLGDFLCPDGVNFADYAVLAEQWLLEELSWDVGTDGGDGFVNFSDWAVFANGWYDTTDINDMADFVEQWVQYGVYCADIAPNEGNGVVDMFDLAVLVENWLVELW